jgi:hypothetical protein
MKGQGSARNCQIFLCVCAEQAMSFVLLIAYSYMILFAFSPNITAIEWTVQGWQFIMMLEKLRDVSGFRLFL